MLFAFEIFLVIMRADILDGLMITAYRKMKENLEFFPGFLYDK